MTMIRRLAVSVACALAASFAAAAFAQPQVPPGVRPPPPGPRAPAPAPSSAPATLDRVVAVVNNEALTLFEMNEQKRILVQQLRESRLQPPSPDVLDRQVLDRLITERALMQYAKETGIRVDDTTVERTILRIAQENKLSPDEFRKALEREGIPYAK